MKILLVLVLLVTLSLIGVYYFQTRISENETQEVTHSVETNTVGTPVKEVLTVLITQNDSGQSGSSVLKEKNGRITVELNLGGSQASVSQPAHIHEGTCADIGEVKYSLENVVDGTSLTTLDSTIEELKENLPLAINVHKSISESDIYVACGNLFSD